MWTVDGCFQLLTCRVVCVCARVQMYGVFYATSFLDLYRSPRQFSAASLSLTVVVDSDEQYLFLVSRPAPVCGRGPRRSLRNGVCLVCDLFPRQLSVFPLTFASRSEPSSLSWDLRLTSRWSK